MPAALPPVPSLDRLASIGRDGSHLSIEPADVRGRFVRWRTALDAILIAIYLGLPFVRIHGHPAVQLDIATRHFFLFGGDFNAQDGFRLVFVLLALGASLLFVTALYGRVWCGWACPQTVFLEGVFRRIERWIDGPRATRLRLDRAPWTLPKLARRALKHTAYTLIALILAHAFLAYFVSFPELTEMIRRDPRQHLTAFVWTMAIAGGLYFDFAFFREQMCIVLCPYGRLQSALMDKDSLIIGYDEGRGEPRGRLTRAERKGTRWTGAPKGDCVDCGRCVAVCPTGIDIRQGSQLECVGCARCIDACDDVMRKLGRAPGLIRYDSETGLAGQKRRLLRGRVLVYGALVVAALGGLVASTAWRAPFEADLMRIEGAPYVLDGGVIRDEYELHLVNKDSVPSRLRLSAEAPASLQLTIPQRSIRLEPLEDFAVPIIATLPRADWKRSFEFELIISDAASGQTREIDTQFLGPMQ